MTEPKRRIGNPLGDSDITTTESMAWYGAHDAAKLLVVAAERALQYSEGRFHSPMGTEIEHLSRKYAFAESAALHIREGRMVERRKKA